MIKVAKVIYEGNVYTEWRKTTKQYCYLTDITDLKKGEYVAVETQYGINVAIFEKYSNTQNDRDLATAWIIQKIDVASLVNKKEKLVALNAIKDKLDSRKKEIEERKIYEMMAKDDPDMAELLKKYDDIVNS